jgi:hypothetical protein
LAIAVRAGFTALMLGKKLVSTTQRLSSSWVRQSAFSTDVAGVGAEPDGPGLVRAAGDRDVGFHVSEPVSQVAGLHPE